MATMPEQLETLEASVTRAGGQVHWARDAAECNAIVGEIVAGHSAREVIKVKSPETLGMEAVGRVFGSQGLYERAQKLARLGRGPIVTAALPGWSAMRGLPEVPEQTFREWWRSRPPRPVSGDRPAP